MTVWLLFDIRHYQGIPIQTNRQRPSHTAIVSEAPSDVSDLHHTKQIPIVSVAAEQTD